MNKNIFENTYFGKPYKTRDGRKAIFSRKDGYTFDLETEESYNPVREDGSFLYNKEGYESSCDIISEWQESINEEELDKLAIDEGTKAIQHFINKEQSKFAFEWADLVKEAYKAGYCKAKSE